MKIYNRFTGEIILDYKRRNLIKANLQGADLLGADLRGANLCDCYFNHTKIIFRGKTVEVNFVEI